MEKQLHGYNDCRHEKVSKLGLRASIFFYLGQLERKVSVAKGKKIVHTCLVKTPGNHIATGSNNDICT